MSEVISWDSLMETIDETWNYELHGCSSDKFILNIDKINNKVNFELTENRFRKRKHNELDDCSFDSSKYIPFKKYKY
jgi:hypothetical protein